MAKITIRNWEDVSPYIGHETAIIWPIYRGAGEPGMPLEEAPMEGMVGFTRHMMQAGKSGDYHDHEDREQVYYFISGHGKMKLDGEIYDVREGDTVHIPAKIKHQLINDSDDWIEHLLVTAETG
jgi:mannose-6-phosphate isomerase-like protein (cupin superfamily)